MAFEHPYTRVNPAKYAAAREVLKALGYETSFIEGHLAFFPSANDLTTYDNDRQGMAQLAYDLLSAAPDILEGELLEIFEDMTEVQDMGLRPLKLGTGSWAIAYVPREEA